MDPDTTFTDILYYIPEDCERLNPAAVNDSIQTSYNVFTVPGKTINEVTLKDVETWFPVPGKYHFRFQFQQNQNIVCWLDISNTTCKLP